MHFYVGCGLNVFCYRGGIMRKVLLVRKVGKVYKSHPPISPHFFPQLQGPHCNFFCFIRFDS